MKITAVKLYILEHPDRKSGGHKLVQVPNLRRIQYTHKGVPSDLPAQQAFIQVETDAGITGRCTASFSEPEKDSQPTKPCRLFLSFLIFLIVYLLPCAAVYGASRADDEPPVWYKETPSDLNYYYGVGSSTESMTDAETEARAALILGIAATVHTDVKSYLRSRNTGEVEDIVNDFEIYSRSTATQEALSNLEILKRQLGKTNYALARLSQEKFHEHIKKQREEVRGIVNHADERLAAGDVIIALQRYTEALVRARPLTFVSRASSDNANEVSLENEIERKRIDVQTEMHIEMLSGNSQSGIYGEPLANALAVQVSYKGMPVPKFPLRATYLWGTGRLKGSTEQANKSVRIYTDAGGKGVCRVDAIHAISGKNHIRITANADVIQLPDSKSMDFHYVSAFPARHKTEAPQITQNGEYGEPMFHEGQEITLEIRVPRKCYIHLFSLLPDGNFDYHQSAPIEQVYDGEGFSIQFIESAWRFQLEKVTVTGERGIGLETLLVVTTPIPWEPTQKAATAKHLIDQLDNLVGKERWQAGTANSRVLPKPDGHPSEQRVTQ